MSYQIYSVNKYPIILKLNIECYVGVKFTYPIWGHQNSLSGMGESAYFECVLSYA